MPIFTPVKEEFAFRLFSFSNFGGTPDDAEQERLRRIRWAAMHDADSIDGFDCSFGRDHYRKAVDYVFSTDQ